MNRNSIFLLLALLALGLVAGAGAVRAQEEEPQPQTETETQTQTAQGQTVYDVIRSEPRLESFETLVEAAALDDNLQQDGPFTVFAPTNEAWAAFEAMAAESEATLTDILLYHVLNGEYSASALARRGALPTLAGEHLFIDAREVLFDINGSPVAGLALSQGQATVANSANITLNETAKVLRSDIQADNGVVHVIDAVVLLPEEGSLFASQQGSPEATIAQVLAEDGRFETFLSLAEQAGLLEQLENSAANYTVFAPTDQAFAAAPQELLEQWLSDPQGELQLILSYHIVGDRLGINQIANDRHIPTLEGRSIVVTRDEEGIYLNGRAIQSANILAANGVIHVVDEVVLP